jgi:protein-S-isoprenylcysteine O-methyltransferase Ste14
MSNFGKDATAICNRVLQLDNNIIGLLICGIAAYNWLAFHNETDHLLALYSQGLYGLLVLSIVSATASAIYLTLAAIILLFLKRPISRYKKVAPNLVAILAVFTAYLFLLVPHGSLVPVNVYIALFLVASGILVTTTSLLFLRRAFSVTPQARVLITAGPYSVARHPMYVGNILSLLGLALLIDSLQAFGLLVICAGLQVWRALYEEKLLEANFVQYAEYKNRVGRFIPRPRNPNRRKLPPLHRAPRTYSARPIWVSAISRQSRLAPKEPLEVDQNEKAA